MKRFGFTVLLVAGIWNMGLAQYEQEVPVKEMKTVLGNNSKIRGFGSLDTRMTELKDDLGLLVGAHGGIILNNNMVIALGGYGLTTDFDFQGSDPQEKMYIYGGYGGLILGAIFSPKEVVHIYTPVLIGAGGIEVTDRNYFHNPNRFNDFDTFAETSAFFVVEPGVEVEVNLTRFFRLSLGASYRLVRETDLVNVTDKDLSGFSGGLSLKFGKF